MPKMDLIYNCDANASIGVGHVFRGVDVVNHFIKQYPELRIAIRGDIDSALVPEIKKSLDSRVIILSQENKTLSYVSIIDTMFYPGSQEVNYEYFTEKKKNCDYLIHLWDVKAYIVPEEVDLVFNHLPYVVLGGSGSYEDYIGFDFLPVPNRFYKQDQYNSNSYVLSVIGSTRNPNMMEPYLEKIYDMADMVPTKVLLSPTISVEQKDVFIKNYPKIEFYQNLADIQPLIEKARAIVTTYGNTTFQALAAKVPVFTLALMDFQKEYGEALQSYGLTKDLGFINDVDTESMHLLYQQNYLKEMHAKQAKVFNTPGLDNIVHIVNNKIQALKI